MRLLLLLFILLQSCQVYRSDFGPTPDQGIPGKSVTEIEAMIIESDGGGPDVLVERSTEVEELVRRRAVCCDAGSKTRRIWVTPKIDCAGNVVSGHYIYFCKYQKEG